MPGQKFKFHMDFYFLGMHVACQYFSKRTGKTEWRRGTAMVKMNLGNFKIDLFDHGVIATVHFRLEAAIKENRSFKPTFL